MANRWALSYQQPGPNPSAGIPPGKAETPRSEAQMAATASSGISPKDWQPTVLNLTVLIVLEVLAFGLLRYVFRNAHGG